MHFLFELLEVLVIFVKHRRADHHQHSIRDSRMYLRECADEAKLAFPPCQLADNPARNRGRSELQFLALYSARSRIGPELIGIDPVVYDGHGNPVADIE